MQIGLQLANFNVVNRPRALAQELVAFAKKAEAIGIQSLWVMDHFFQIEFIGPAEMDMLEAYSTLAFLAGQTEKLELGVLVTGVTYRHPGVLLKTVTTLDVLSQGRVWLGLGAAWFEREHLGLGIEFPPVKVRFERLEEVLQLSQQMWSDENGPFRGRHLDLKETICQPQPHRGSGIPILIGGMGEKKTLRLVAQYAQAANFYEYVGLAVLKRKLGILEEHCHSLGREYSGILKTVLGQTSISNKASAKKLLEKLEQLAELGFGKAIYSLVDFADHRVLDTFAEYVLPELKRLA